MIAKTISKTSYTKNVDNFFSEHSTKKEKETAFTQIFIDLKPRLENFLRKYINQTKGKSYIVENFGGIENVNDKIQDVVIGCFEKLLTLKKNQFDPSKKYQLTTWLYTIARNDMVNEIKANYSHLASLKGMYSSNNNIIITKKGPNLSVIEGDCEDGATSYGSYHNTVTFEEKDTIDSIFRYLENDKKFKEKQINYFKMKFIEGYKYREIADKHSTSIQAVRDILDNKIIPSIKREFATDIRLIR